MIDTLYNQFINIFGEYTPVIGTDPVTGNSIDCINFGYIGSVLFAIVIAYGVLRIVGNLFKHS